MDLFSDFCNICYKGNDGSIKDISAENMTHLNDTLITLIGHADILKHNGIYLCQLCCEQLTHVDKFREMCFSHLIHLRQMYLNMKFKLNLEDDADAAGNTLAKFVHEEVLRRNSVKTSIRPVSISTDCLQITKKSPKLNKNDALFSRQVKNLHSERKECAIDSECNSVSVTNSVAECDKFRVAFANEKIENEIVRRYEVTKLEKFETECDKNSGLSVIDNDIESNTSQIQFMKEKFDLKNEIENRESEDFKLKIYENESSDHVKFLEMPAVSDSEASVSTEEEIHVKQENSISGESEVGTIENVSSTFEFVNVCTSTYKQEYGDGDIESGEDAKVEMKVQRRRKNNSTTAIRDTQRSRSYGREYRNRSNPATVPSATHGQVRPCAKSHMCVVCSKTFTTSSSLIIHKRVHSGERPYKCTVCKMMFKQLPHLAAHERTHSGERPYKCIICKKTFTNRSSLAVHERAHRGEKPYKCNACNHTFTQSSSLTAHERTHNGERPYKCNVCKKAFTHSSSLAAHTRTHTGERPYKCTICNKMFTQLGHLTTHERTHSVEGPYK